AYKVKKPVNLGFLDFSTLERRHYFCEQEVHLNRRLAPTVYLGVVPVTRTATGIRLDAPSPLEPKGKSEEEIIDWAVKMERLPEAATFSALIRAREGEAAAEPRSAPVRQEPHSSEGENDGGRG